MTTLPPSSEQAWRRSCVCAARGALDHRLPARYERGHRDLFDSYARPTLRPFASVLDIGAGRSPTFPEAARPADCTYVGLDLSGQELASAPTGSYDDVVASDVRARVPSLIGQFDAIISWQVLEHVKPLPTAIENLRSYLRPGGSSLLSSRARWGCSGS